MTLKNLEWSIFKTITRKMTLVRPMTIKQVDQLSEYFKTDFNIEKSAKLEKVVTMNKGVHIELIFKHILKNK